LKLESSLELQCSDARGLAELDSNLDKDVQEELEKTSDGLKKKKKKISM